MKNFPFVAQVLKEIFNNCFNNTENELLFLDKTSEVKKKNDCIFPFFVCKDENSAFLDLNGLIDYLSTEECYYVKLYSIQNEINFALTEKDKQQAVQKAKIVLNIILKKDFVVLNSLSDFMEYQTNSLINSFKNNGVKEIVFCLNDFSETISINKLGKHFDLYFYEFLKINNCDNLSLILNQLNLPQTIKLSEDFLYNCYSVVNLDLTNDYINEENENVNKSFIDYGIDINDYDPRDYE